MDAINTPACVICKDPMMEAKKENHCQFQSREVVELENCKHIFHKKCLERFWDTPTCLAYTLEDITGCSSAEDDERLTDDLIFSGVDDPDTFQFEDVPTERNKDCPVCQQSARNVRVITASQLKLFLSPGEETVVSSRDNPSGTADNGSLECICPEPSLEDIQEVISFLKKEGLIRPEVNIDIEAVRSVILAEFPNEKIKTPRVQDGMMEYINAQDIISLRIL